MQRKGEGFCMTAKEYCRYIRTYTELEGLQQAHTLLYCAAALPQGVLMELRWEQGGALRRSAVLAPQGSFARAMRILRYLCENSIGLEQWLDVLQDQNLPYRLLDGQEPPEIPGFAGKNGLFCSIC